MHRFYLALHATMPAALAVLVLVHLWGPPGLAPLAQRPVWTVWVLIGVWLLSSALAAWALRTLALWRVALGSTSALLAVAGLAGLALGSAQGPAMLISLGVVGLGCGGIAAFVGPRRVQAPRRKSARHAVASAGAATRAPAVPLRRHLRGLGRWLAPAHGPFWLSGVLAVESFRLAHIVATEPARSSGMLGLLIAFFVALPAATLRHWAPRTSMGLWVLAVLAYGGLAAKAGLWQWAAAAGLCVLAAAVPLVRKRGRVVHPSRISRSLPSHAAELHRT